MKGSDEAKGTSATIEIAMMELSTKFKTSSK